MDQDVPVDLPVEALRLETVFGDGIRGLAVYGAKLVRPDSIAVLTASMT